MAQASEQAGDEAVSGRRPYRRSMHGWWRKDTFFVRYMIREATALIVAAYAIVLLAGLLSLSSGEAAWNFWLVAMRSPVSIALHSVMLAGMIFHGYTWFEIMPKTMPALFVGGKRIAQETIMMFGWVCAGGAAAALFAVARLFAP
jgi:succinate dehydrogenase subunit C